jgi:hypothetical protein
MPGLVEYFAEKPNANGWMENWDEFVRSLVTDFSAHASHNISTSSNSGLSLSSMDDFAFSGSLIHEMIHKQNEAYNSIWLKWTPEYCESLIPKTTHGRHTVYSRLHRYANGLDHPLSTISSIKYFNRTGSSIPTGSLVQLDNPPTANNSVLSNFPIFPTESAAAPLMSEVSNPMQ